MYLAAAVALDAGVAATEGALHIHGGVGFTWEHPIHLLPRRAQATQSWWGGRCAARLRRHAVAESQRMNTPNRRTATWNTAWDRNWSPSVPRYGRG